MKVQLDFDPWKVATITLCAILFGWFAFKMLFGLFAIFILSGGF